MSVSHLPTSSRQEREIVIRTDTAAQVFEYGVRIDETGSGTCLEVTWTDNRCKRKETLGGRHGVMDTWRPRGTASQATGHKATSEAQQQSCWVAGMLALTAAAQVLRI